MGNDLVTWIQIVMHCILVMNSNFKNDYGFSWVECYRKNLNSTDAVFTNETIYWFIDDKMMKIPIIVSITCSSFKNTTSKSGWLSELFWWKLMINVEAEEVMRFIFLENKFHPFSLFYVMWSAWGSITYVLPGKTFYHCLQKFW